MRKAPKNISIPAPWALQHSPAQCSGHSEAKSATARGPPSCRKWV